MTKEAVETPQISRGAWFDDLVSDLRSHELQLETDTASKPLKDFYNRIIFGSAEETARASKATLQKYFVSRIVLDYVEIISNSALAQLNRLAIDHNDSEVLVWAEIPDDQDELEKALIMAEAKINAKYHEFGFDMNTTIVEESDYLSTPNHYSVVAEKKS